MAHIIHCRDTTRGKRYRVWSTVTDSYLSKSMDAETVLDWLIQDHCAGITYDLKLMIRDASERGTNAGQGFNDGRTLKSPWRKGGASRCRRASA